MCTTYNNPFYSFCSNHFLLLCISIATSMWFFFYTNLISYVCLHVSHWANSEYFLKKTLSMLLIDLVLSF